jgi:hypothetical protein
MRLAQLRAKDKEDMVKKLGAIHYIDSQSKNVVKELAEFGSSSENAGAAEGAGGAKVILAGKDWQSLL